MNRIARSSAKVAGSFDRTVALADTLALVPSLRNRYGITRVGELTYLDRIGIPVMTAVVPRSRDDLGVYNGKGRTREEAGIGAVMEAVERQIGAVCDLPTRAVRVREIERDIDLDALGLYARLREEQIECVDAFDLLTGREVPVPIALVRCPWTGDPTFPSTSTNGLASGNTLTEAVYHGLFELVERHVWSMAEIRLGLVPRLLFGPDPPAFCAPGVGEVGTPSGDSDVDELRDRIERGGLRSRVLVLREGSLPPVALCTIYEERVDPPICSLGLGASWSPGHAAVRAITEAAQSRAVDIAATREDMVDANDDGASVYSHARRANALPRGTWFFDGPAPTVSLAEIADASCDDLGVELERLARVVHALGAPTLAVVDLSPADGPIAVARVVVPELETYCVDRRVGLIARAEVARLTPTF